jgi:hypothetical protein
MYWYAYSTIMKSYRSDPERESELWSYLGERQVVVERLVASTLFCLEKWWKKFQGHEENTRYGSDTRDFIRNTVRIAQLATAMCVSAPFYSFKSDVGLSLRKWCAQNCKINLQPK